MRVVGVHKGLLWGMTISAIRPEECIPKAVQRKQIGNLLPRGLMAGRLERTKTGLREITPAKLPPCPQPTWALEPGVITHLPCSLQQLPH